MDKSMDKNMGDGSYFFAVDLGATSGRTIVGSLAEEKLTLEELTRFDNTLIETGGHYYWDLYALYHEVIKGLKTAADRRIDVRSIGIDTWGCDFVFVGDDGQLLRNPMAYRDPHTLGTMDHYFAHAVPKEKVYEKTGIQFMNFNSLFQLYQMRRDDNTALRHAAKTLFIPDALSYMLTGKAVCEYTVASTSQMLNPNTGDLDEELIASLGMTRGQFGVMTAPATVIGTLTPEVQKLTGLGAVPVVAVAGHDTASAVAAVPARDEHFAYLSSGTWSLMGIETRKAIINDKSFERNFTNEGGIEGTTRFLKNICGMWIYERCRSEWPEAKKMGHAELQAGIIDCEPFRSIINPDDTLFANPDSMVEAINSYCEKTRQPVPRTPAEYCRCIFDSLALRYRQVFTWLREFADFDITVLHIIGGGSMNQYLNQFTANSCGVTVLAGPQEGTAIGNVMLQAKASGEVEDIWQMRDIIARSIELRRFEPQDRELWDAAYERYLKTIL
jgi:rhamnulokinase